MSVRIVSGSPKCPKCGHPPVRIEIKRSGGVPWEYAEIDWCMVSLVKALNNAGLETRWSCCGHGEANPVVILRDGRKVEVFPLEEGGA